MPALCSRRLQWLNSLHFLLRRVDYDLISSYTLPSFMLGFVRAIFVLSADSTIALLLAELNQEWTISISSSVWQKIFPFPNCSSDPPICLPSKRLGQETGGQTRPATHFTPCPTPVTNKITGTGLSISYWQKPFPNQLFRNPRNNQSHNRRFKRLSQA